MCDFDKGFILCKCDSQSVTTHNKKSRRAKRMREENIEYVWSLNKYHGPKEELVIGRYLFPVNELSGGLTSEFVLRELSKRNCFDFAYTPSEGDNLIMTVKGSSSRMEFIFRNGKWVSDHYSPFDDEIAETYRGTVVGGQPE